MAKVIVSDTQFQALTYLNANTYVSKDNTFGLTLLGAKRLARLELANLWLRRNEWVLTDMSVCQLEGFILFDSTFRR